MTRRKAREVAQGVTIDPLVSGGHPCMAGTGVVTAFIASRFKAGESVYHLAVDYGVAQGRIEDALRWECLSRRSQLRRIEKARA